MLDQDFHLPPANLGRRQVFYPTGSVPYFGQPWRKSKWMSMVSMTIVQPGGGGGGGFSRTAGSNGSGGAGGACGTITRLIIPAIMLPDILYIYVPPGGIGGTAGVAGGHGQIATISMGRTQNVPNWLLYSSGGNANGGSAGTSSSASGGTAPNGPAAQPFSLTGFYSTTNGIAGGNAGTGTGAAGTSITAWAASPLSPGAGGAGCGTTGPGTNFAGGAQTAFAALDFGMNGYYNTAIVAAGLAAGGHGNAGVRSLTPFLNCGGSGGGSNNSGTGGNGGAGGYGCGGGGGGAGVTGGTGGNGGDGLTIITAW